MLGRYPSDARISGIVVPLPSLSWCIMIIFSPQLFHHFLDHFRLYHNVLKIGKIVQYKNNDIYQHFLRLIDKLILIPLMGLFRRERNIWSLAFYCTFSRIFELCNFWGALAKKGLDPKHLIYFSFSTPFFSQLMYPRIWGDNLDKKTMMVQLPMLSL